MKRSMILLAAVFAMASTTVLADNSAVDKTAANSKAVALTDAELDNITAGSATVIMAVFNSGNASVIKFDDPTNAHCVNCVSPSPFDGHAKIMSIQNQGHPIPMVK